MTEITTFIYDGNGVRVKKIDPDGGVTYYVRALQAGLSIYEVLSTTTGITKTSYYYAGAQRVAMRVTAGVSTTVIYLHGDHLGSTSLTTDAGGQVLARVLYYPYGEERYTVGTLQTDYGYTGQRKNGYLDTYSMGARDYDPRLGRWLSADTIVPNPANSQSLNRYAYVLGNPLKYIDPTGHISDDPHERREAANIIEELSYYGVTIDVDWGWDGETWNEGSWLLGELNLVLQSVKDLAAKISEELDNDLKDWDNFRKVVGPVTIRRERSWAITPDGKRERPARTYGNTITLYNGTFDPYGSTSFDYEGTKGTIVHELGHAWDHNQDREPSNNIGWYTAREKSPTEYGEDRGDNEKWAELVACWVYKSQIDEGRTLGPRHQQYVSLMVHMSYLGACPTHPTQSK